MYENRENRRFECEEVLDCYQAGNDFEARVLDVSWGGLRISCASDLVLGSHIYVQHRQVERFQFPLRARVCWKRPGDSTEFGLEFCDEKSLSEDWVGELLPKRAFQEVSAQSRRREVRVQVSLPISLEDHCEGETLDLSLTGARFRMENLVEADELDFFLCLPDALIELKGQVLRAEPEVDGWVHSVRFCAPDAEDREQLRRFMSYAIS